LRGGRVSASKVESDHVGGAGIERVGALVGLRGVGEVRKVGEVSVGVGVDGHGTLGGVDPLHLHHEVGVVLVHLIHVHVLVHVHVHVAEVGV